MPDPTLIHWLGFACKHPEHFKAAVAFDDNPSLGRTLQLVPPQSNNSLAAEPHVLPLPPILVQTAIANCQTWEYTGYGSITTHSEWFKPNKIKVCLVAGCSYIHYISDLELQTYRIWCNNLSKKIWMH